MSVLYSQTVHKNYICAYRCICMYIMHVYYIYGERERIPSKEMILRLSYKRQERPGQAEEQLVQRP